MTEGKGKATPKALKQAAVESRRPANRAEYMAEDAEGADQRADELVTKQVKVNVRAAENLAKRQAGRTVHFDADCGLYTLDSGSSTAMQTDGGKVVTIETPHIYVDFSKGPVALNPNDTIGPLCDAVKIKLLRKDLEEVPQRAAITGLMEVGDGLLPRPMETWDNLKRELKLEAVKTFGLDVERTIKYEIQNDGDSWLIKALDALLLPDEPADELSVAEPVESGVEA